MNNQGSAGAAAALEILLMLRRIVRFIAKLFLVIWVICGMMEKEDAVTSLVSILLAAFNLAVLVFYDRLLFKLAEKSGRELYLEN